MIRKTEAMNDRTVNDVRELNGGKTPVGIGLQK